MKNVKLLTAAALLFAAAGAYAGSDDGNVEQNVRSNQVAANQQQKAPASAQQAPAPVASGSQAEVRGSDSSIVSPNP